MNYITIKHLDFVPNKLIKEYKEGDYSFIGVFTRKRNNRTYKNKKWAIGQISFHPKSKRWGFIPFPDWNIGEESLFIIASVVYQLDKGKLKFDDKNGELSV